MWSPEVEVSQYWRSSFERLEWQDAALSRVISLVFVPFNLRRIKHSFELGDTRQECFFIQSDRATPVIDFVESSYVNVLMHFFDFNVNSGSIEPRSIGIDCPLPTRVTPFFTTKKKAFFHAASNLLKYFGVVYAYTCSLPQGASQLLFHEVQYNWRNI